MLGHGQKKGADSARPASRHHEAPVTQTRQAAPVLGAVSVGCVAGLGKIRGFRCSPLPKATQIVICGYIANFTADGVIEGASDSKSKVVSRFRRRAGPREV